MIGEILGHYGITSQLGKGGMGEVYQAKDQKLGRDAAIKVLPEKFAKDSIGLSVTSSDELWGAQVWRCCPKFIPKDFAVC
jgi:serine/threonine protein kinase